MPRDLQKKSPGLLDFFSPRTMGPSGFLGPVLSRPAPEPFRDFLGRDSPAGKPNIHIITVSKLYCLLSALLNLNWFFGHLGN